MKKIIALMLALMTVCTFAAGASAEGSFFSFLFGGSDSESSDAAASDSTASDAESWSWGDLASWLGEAANEAGEWLGENWGDISGWIGENWGEASEWIEKAWGDSSSWATGIWGEASEWMADKSGDVSKWLAESFEEVTENGQKAWEWIGEHADELKSTGEDLIDTVKKTVAATGELTEEDALATVLPLLKTLGINEEDAQKVWETVKTYAEQAGLSTSSAIKLIAPYLLQLCAENPEQSGDDVPAVNVAQYLTGIMEKLGIENNTEADELVEQLNEALSEIE